MVGSSKSSTSSSTTNKTANAANETGIQLVESNGNNIVSTDHDAVELSFESIQRVAGEAFDFADNSNERAIDFADDANQRSFGFADEIAERSFNYADDALDSVESANERIESVTDKSVASIENLATTLKTGDLKTTQTIYLAGAGIAGILVLSLIVSSAVKSKAGK